MRHVFSVAIGPVGFRVGSDWRGPVAALEQLYAAYPKPQDGTSPQEPVVDAPQRK